MRGAAAIGIVCAAGLATFALAAGVNYAERARAEGGPADAREWAARAVRPPGELPAGGGPELIERYRCLLCHTLDGRGARVGPLLNGVRERKTRAEIIEWLRDPQAIKPGSSMPKLPFTPVEEQVLADYLMTK